MHELEQGAAAEPPSSSTSSTAAPEDDAERQAGKKIASAAPVGQRERPKANRATSDVFARSMRETRMVAGYEEAELEA